MDKPIAHRGAASNATNRFERFRAEACDDGWDLGEEDLPPLKTEVTVDASRTIITRNSSPDVPFDRSINPYRGCEHVIFGITLFTGQYHRTPTSYKIPVL